MELQYKLSQFEGPLDLLLHLLDKDKIDIKDIFVSDITEQYLAYVRQLPEVDMDSASEFLIIAAHLLEIKSRSLLPKPPPLEEGEEDPEQALIRRLTEYKRYKESSEQLHQIEEDRKGVYYKLPEEVPMTERIELEALKLDALLLAFQDILARVEQKAEVRVPQEIKRDAYSIKEKMSFIRRKLSMKKKFPFSSLFEGDTSRSEVVTTFLALLELLRSRFLSVTQKELFSEIMISLNMEETKDEQ